VIVMRIALWSVVLLSTSLCAGLATAQGDPANGSVLYHTKYRCTDCHTSSPGPNSGLSSGATVAGLLDAINIVGPMSSRFSITLANNQADLADIAAYLASVTGAAPAVLNLDQHGLTGSWYNAATDGQGMELEFFVDAVSAGTAYLQGAWFTFDVTAGGVDHQRWYTYAGNAQSGKTSIAVTLYQNIGGNFNALPVTNAVAVGTGSLSFTDCATGSFSYNFTDGSGRSGNVPLTRLTQNVTCAAPATEKATNPDFGFSGNWYDATTSGQGFVIEANPLSGVLFVTWYTYAASGAAAGAAGQRWFTAQAAFTAGMRSIPVTLYETTGGVFDTAAPKPTTTAVGTGTVTFASCTAASITYAFTSGGNAGKSGTIQLTRVGPTPAGCGP
jgi:hypothetical protein